jgi:glycosyltransferase involved in cell wall biosynthesis
MPAPLPKTLVVMPAFNEEASVGAVVAEVREKLPGVDCLVVDDGSADATSERARNAGAAVATLPFNLGVGGAMRLGFRYALENGYHNVVQIDADGQHDPSGVPALLAELESADIVLGARFAGEGDYDARGPRRWAMRLFATTISRIAHTTLTDTTSGFRASGPRAVALFARHYPAEYLGDTLESLVIASRSGLRIRQVAVAMRPRAGGVPSHNPLRAAAYLGRATLALVFALARPRSTYRVEEL